MDLRAAGIRWTEVNLFQFAQPAAHLSFRQQFYKIDALAGYRIYVPEVFVYLLQGRLFINV
jgi:hypothetical protein